MPASTSDTKTGFQQTEFEIPNFVVDITVGKNIVTSVDNTHIVVSVDDRHEGSMIPDSVHPLPLL